MTVFEQNIAERNSANLERIADSLESIDAVLRKISKAFEPQIIIEHPEDKKSEKDKE